MLRTHTCGELTAAHADQTVTLCGWVEKTRDLGKGGVFVDVRDRYGKTQLVVRPHLQEMLETAKQLRSEFVILGRGKVSLRPLGQANANMATGEVEILLDELQVLNASKVPPFLPSAQEMPSEDARLKYRFIDLRRPKMQQTLVLRSRIVKKIRDYFEENGFIDIETPILGRSTPEGARDYLVPSRVHNGQFYALPQSPQIYKQLMMIAGYDRYVQVARCFRDEDLRADRQPEFTQLDMEMSFVDEEDIIGMIDGLMKRLAREILGIELPLPLPRMSYDEAMRRFGHDAPDLRFGMELIDCSAWAKTVDFRIFRGAVDEGKAIRAINVPNAAELFTRKKIDELTLFVQEDFGLKGLAWLKCTTDGKLEGPIAKNFTESQLAELASATAAVPGSVLLFAADEYERAGKALYGLRRRLGLELKLYDPGQMHFSWVVRFPMFAYDAEENRWAAMHHPFTAPLDSDLPKLESDPAAVRAKAYDLVINGYEAGGGTIRIHDNVTQQKVFQLLGMSPEEAEHRFGFLLEALRFGAPPHGGIALGIDRLIMLFAGLDNIRDCVTFPKTAKAIDLMTEAPNVVDDRQLRELGIQVKPKNG
ncbi:MAG: aspartate--tRNA ligase [Planctomycetota bacterium]|nr:aspartate--tRNA ligase [Blastopirellula sp.]